ncbi:MAG TPA: response regulator transcription factor [Acidimicrobiia bacterium]|nr:response regulator transcription factor [Acidimicrobiia bacterium]
MIEERPLRIWIDDHNPIFRLGLAACLEPPFLLGGESVRFSPPPDMSRTDILVFELDAGGLGNSLRLVQESPSLLLVAIAANVDDELLVEAIEAGVTGALLRGDANPNTFLHTLRSAAAGNGSLPTAVLGRLLSRPRVGLRSPGDLTDRELGVLRLLSKGESTRQIAEDLCYSEKTVKNIVHDVLVRMNCRNRAQAVALATRRGLI